MTSAAPALADKNDGTKPPKEKKICRRETVTGSIVGFKSVCHTKAEWDSIDASNNGRAQDDLNRAGQLGSIVGGKPQ
jgi:hypothetical protein